MDREIQRIIGESYDKAMELLRANAQKLSELSSYLLEKETITGDEFMEILGPEENEKITSLPLGSENA